MLGCIVAWQDTIAVCANPGFRIVRVLPLQSDLGSGIKRPATPFCRCRLGLGEGRRNIEITVHSSRMTSGQSHTPHCRPSPLPHACCWRVETCWADESIDSRLFWLILASTSGGIPTTRVRGCGWGQRRIGKREWTGANRSLSGRGM